MKQALSASRDIFGSPSVYPCIWNSIERAQEADGQSGHVCPSATECRSAREQGAEGADNPVPPRLYRPLFLNPVAAGFPSPADDYIERSLDLNEHLIRNPPATFFVRAQGDSMLGAGIHDGDILVVDRSLTPAHNRVVIASVHGELTVKRLWKRDGMVVLRPENPAYAPLDVSSLEQCEVWGVVTAVIHAL
ncbi:translesion error-prone DNA polymerase V autoproteolytic subunit [Desulfovibrio mangrovi]|uniref:LexA family protein n=1 Tax=Desulfovibrio mangrovi TaxID=2976983 RepID=UPI003084664C